MQKRKNSTTKDPPEIISSKKEINRRIRRLKGELSNLLYKLHTQSLVLNYGTRITPAKPIDIVRAMASWKEKDRADLTLKNIMINSVISADQRHAGAGIACARSICTPHDTVSKKSGRIPLGNRAQTQDMDEMLRYLVGNGMIHELMKTVIENGGMAANLDFSLNAGNNFVIESSSCSGIPGEVHPLFSEVKSAGVIREALIVAVLGKIDSVSEIDHLLRGLADDDRQAVLLSFAFSPDVVTTLDSNWTSGRLRVVPFRMEEDEKNREILENSGVSFSSIEIGKLLVNMTLDDFSVNRGVKILQNKIYLESVGGATQNITIRIPQRYSNMTGVIQDRCMLAQKACISLAKSGPYRLNASKQNNYDLVISHAAAEVGSMAADSCKSLLDSLGSIIAV